MLSALLLLAIYAASDSAPQQLPAPYKIQSATPVTKKSAATDDREQHRSITTMSLPIQRIAAFGPNAREQHEGRIEGEKNALGPDSHIDRILGLPPQLEGRDPWANDGGPLNAAARVTSIDTTASPIAFNRLFAAPDGSGSMVRGNGALYATFPFATYKRTKKGMIILQPPGSVFRIGMPLEWTMPDRGVRDPRQSELSARLDGSLDTQVSGRIDRRIDMRRGNAGQTQRAAPTPPKAEAAPPIKSAEETALPRISSDESYRRAFFASLRKANATTGASK